MDGEASMVAEANESAMSGAAVREAEPACTQGLDDEEGEMKLTIRKLELPVRPRGVLAE
jgi:hypothetical protein